MVMMKRVTLDHGSGGLKTRELVEGLFLERLGNPWLNPMEDSAVIELGDLKLAFTTDSYVVDPIFFPGGDIGSLSVHGTINDLAMKGAWPKGISLAVIIEEGLSMDELEMILESIGNASRESGVPVVTGDTKVVPKGKGDKVFINTSGVGFMGKSVDIGAHRVSPGDSILVSGSIGDHGITVLTQREGLHLSGELKSDTAPLHNLVRSLWEEIGEDLHCLRDPTRGGLATVLSELSERSGLAMEVFEDAIPIRDEVMGACEILGLDPLYLANEGKLVAFVSESVKDKSLEVMRRDPLGTNAACIGHVESGDGRGRVVLNTTVGGKRPLYALMGNPLPRIC